MLIRRLLSTVLLIICYNTCLSVEYDTIRFDDGSYALLCRKWPPNYYGLSIDSISIERKTFTAIYDGCGKSYFFLKEKDLNLIKETSVYEDIHCYYIIQDDGDERMPVEEPTALILRQNGRKFYITCSKQAHKNLNICELPTDKPLTFHAYLFDVYSGKDNHYQKVIIYKVEM